MHAIYALSLMLQQVARQAGVNNLNIYICSYDLPLQDIRSGRVPPPAPHLTTVMQVLHTLRDMLLRHIFLVAVPYCTVVVPYCTVVVHTKHNLMQEFCSAQDCIILTMSDNALSVLNGSAPNTPMISL